MREEALDEEILADPHVEQRAVRGRAVHVDGRTGHDLVEATAEPIATEGRDLHRLRLHGRRPRPGSPRATVRDQPAS